MSVLVLSLAAGFRTVFRNYGLVLLVLATNLGLGLLLAVPFALLVERDLAHTGASSSMMYGFDYDWWSGWSSRTAGFAAAFGPDLLGGGFGWRNLELLLRGATIPRGLLAGSQGVDATILGLAAAYLLLQLFLTGGLIGVFRAPLGGWTLRGFLHGCGFYFGRIVRVSLLALAAAALVLAAHAPLAAWISDLAREAVSERSALALTLGRDALLLLALAFVHMVASYAKVILVNEERRSASLAVLSSAGFCLRRLGPACGQYVAVAAAGALLLVLFGLVGSRLPVVGWRTQLAALALAQAFVAGGITLRLGLLASQLELQRKDRR